MGLAASGFGGILALAGLAAGPTPAFSSSAECGDGAGAVCYYEVSCSLWRLIMTPTIVPLPYFVCVSWTEESRYWSLDTEADGDSADSEAEEPTRIEPTE